MKNILFAFKDIVPCLQPAACCRFIGNYPIWIWISWQDNLPKYGHICGRSTQILMFHCFIWQSFSLCRIGEAATATVPRNDRFCRCVLECIELIFSFGMHKFSTKDVSESSWLYRIIRMDTAGHLLLLLKTVNAKLHEECHARDPFPNRNVVKCMFWRHGEI